MYIVLTDEHPFAVDACTMSTSILFRKMLVKPTRKEPLDLAEVDREARDLIAKLLLKDPAKRITASKALQHEWLAGAVKSSLAGNRTQDMRKPKAEKSPKAPTFDKDLVSRIQHFGKCSKFERAVLTLAAHQASNQEVEDLKAAFFELDVSRTGTLSKAEIKAGFKKCGHTISDNDLDNIFVVLDADESGKVCYTEWLAATLKPKLLASDKAIDQLYQFFDLEGNGKVSPEELMHVLQDDDQVKEVLRRGDRAGDGHLSEEEFRCLIAGIAKSLGGKR